MKEWEKYTEKIKSITDSYWTVLGGNITSENMQLLTTDQHTLLAYRIILDEVMEGGFIQLIQNGWGKYIFNNPFAKVLKSWGVTDLAKLIYAVAKEYHKNQDFLEKDRSEEEFMALYEDFETLNDMGDAFLDEIQEDSTVKIGKYVENNSDDFVINK